MSSERGEAAVSDLLRVLTCKDGGQAPRLKEALLQFLTVYSEGRTTEDCLPSSNPHSVASLLVQQLLTHFSQAFVSPGDQPLAQDTLRGFLTQDSSLLLLMAIQLIAHMVDSTYPELAELLLVVLKTLLNKSPEFEIDSDTVLELIHLYKMVEPEAPPTTNAFTSPSIFSCMEGTSPQDIMGGKHFPDGCPSPGTKPYSIVVPNSTITRLLEIIQKRQNISEEVSDRALHLLLLSVLESTATKSGSKGTTRVGSTLNLLQGLSTLFEEVISLWLQSYNQSEGKDPSAGLSESSKGASALGEASYKGTAHIARVVLRLWLALTSEVLHSSLSAQQLSDTKPLLFAPVATVSAACYNLQRTGVFRGNEFLDHEFTLIILEALFACLHSINLFAMISTSSVNDFFQTLKDCLTDGCHEWFAYLCSKLHGISESGLSERWTAVMDYCHRLLVYTLRELIITSSHIQACQKASKSALAGEASLRPVVYSVEVAMGFDKLTQRLSKIAQLLLDIFKSVPMIQFLSLQLLSETAKDMVGIIAKFLINISDPSVRSNPEVLDLYLELLENVWFRLSPDYGGSASWWKKLSNYFILLQEANQEVVHQVLYHIQCLFSHESSMLKSQLTKHVILPFQAHLLSQVKQKVYRSGAKGARYSRDLSRAYMKADLEQSLEDKRKIIVSLFLKLLLKVASNTHSLEAYLSENTSIYSLFLLLPLPSFRSSTLRVIDESIKTLRKLSAQVPNQESEAALERALIQILLKFAFTAQVERIPDLCLMVAEGKADISPYGLAEVDQVHHAIRNTFESQLLQQLLTPSFLTHIAIMEDVWGILAQLAPQGDVVLHLLRNNHMWDVIQIFAPFLGGFLSRLYQRQTSGADATQMKFIGPLREIAVSLLCHLLSLAHFLCWQKRDVKVMEVHCEEVHHALLSGGVCSISNGHKYCTTLLKTACCFKQSQHQQTDKSPSSHKTSTPVLMNVKPRVLEGSSSRESSKPIPIRKHRSSKRDSVSSVSSVGSEIKRRVSTSILDASLKSWSFVDSAAGSSSKSWVMISMSDSELSGYEADVERGTNGLTEVGESCDELDESQLLQSLTNYLVPMELRERLWSLKPLLHCIELLRDGVKKDISVNCEKCVEVFLYQLYTLLKADRYNVTILAGKGLLEILLDSFATLFESESERSITCCHLICRIAEVLATHQISAAETRKLFLRLQVSKTHLEKLPSLLRSVAQGSSQYLQPSAFVEFSYRRPLQVLDTREMLMIPYSTQWGENPRSIVMWLNVGKYPLQTQFHILTVCTGEVFLQIWACACSGDIIIRLRQRLQLDLQNSDNDPQSATLGSPIMPGQWHHLVVSVLPLSMQPVYELQVVVDGKDTFHYNLQLPLPLSSSSQTQFYIAGGAVSSHTSEHHLKLVNAENAQLAWKLGSLYVLEGFKNPSLATILFEMGPDCACSNQQAAEAVMKRHQFGHSMDANADTSVIHQPPISEEEKLLLTQEPYLAYSAHNANKVFVMSWQQWSEEEPILGVTITHDIQWVLSANAVTRPHLLDVLHATVGMEQLIYLYAKCVSEGCVEEVQCHALSLILLAVQRSLLAAMELDRLGGVRLLQQVLRTPQAAVGKSIAEVFLTWCCGVEREEVKDVSILEHILLDWRIWHKAPEDVWEFLLWQMDSLLASGNLVNRQCFSQAEAIVKILLTSKERALEKLPPLTPNIACLLVRVVECIMDCPPQVDCLRYICDHLLVSDINDVKFVAETGILDTSMSVFDGRRASMPPHGSFSPPPLGSDVDGDPLSPRFSVMVFSDSNSEPEEEIAFDIQPEEGRLPDSSYTEEDSLFTWTDITGQLLMKDSDAPEDMPTNLEVALLGLVRKVITVMPDNLVRRVIGQAIQHESLIAIAHNPDIVIRTAVIRVLDIYFQRGGDGVRANFVQVKGFNLLASQLKQFKVSFGLMSALCNIVIGLEVNLKSEQVGTLQFLRTLSGFHMHAVIPVIQCTVNTIGQPQLCHATLCILRELFEVVKGMPTFMLNNGLLKLLCQLIVITTEHTPLSREEKELILSDVLQMCKLVVIFAISADQEEQFRMLENLLVCLRHCSEEIQKTKGPSSIPVVYLHHFQYHVLVQALRYFYEDIDTSGGVGGFIPTLPSSTQPPGHSDLTSRFASTCNNAIDWAVYGVEPYSTEHAQYFLEQVAMPAAVTFDPQAKTAPMDIAFVRFLLHYFHRALLPMVKKSGSFTSTLERQRYSVSSRTQLNDQLSRLLGHLVSPLHEDSVRSAALREFWGLEDVQSLFSFILSSSLKKLLGCRMVLTVVHLMRRGHQVDSSLMEAFNEIFQVVCRSGATRLRVSTKLSSLLSYEEEVDMKKRHRYEALLEEMGNVDQRWMERYEFDLKGFIQRQRTVYGRLVEKSRNRQQAIDRASASVTHRIFEQQSALKTNFLEKISAASMNERDSLHWWRRVILINTHPRALWAYDEGRVMCWQLDPTEGPSRVRRRMMRAPRTVEERHLLPAARTGKDQKESTTPLAFIFENTAYHGNDALFKKIVPQEGEDILTVLPWRCSSISPDNCCKGNLIISNMRCYFVGDEPLGDPNITKVLPWDEETTLLSWEHSEIVEIHRRRHLLKNNALEIFLINGKTMLLAFDSPKDRNTVHTEIIQLDLPNLVDSGESESDKLKQVTVSWKQGEITNFEYLMELNKLAGRTFNDLMQYPVFPFILADYYSQELDLRRPETFRKLWLPISIQDESKTQKYLNTYNFLANESRGGSATPGLPNHTSKPYHYGSHYSNSGIVLHFLVRLPPFTDMFLTFQGRNFDIADRTFRNISMTWWLSSSESATDVKELIPEFFYLPEFLVNTERFDFGECQTGERVDNVLLPPWANRKPRLFILKHRQALESEYVSQHLHEWIDLVFGYKQTGKAAIQAVNVFHPATYYGADGIDIDSVSDRTQQAAMRAMVKTYGQMPLQLFREPHPPRSKSTKITAFRMRIGSALKRFNMASTSSLNVKFTNPYFWRYIFVHKAKFSISNSDCDFFGAQGPPDMMLVHTSAMSFIPERIVCIGNGEVVLTELGSSFFQNSSPAHSSLLVVWEKWDNSLVVRSTLYNSAPIRLYQHPLNRVTCCECACSGQMIVSGGSAGVVSFWQITNTQYDIRYNGRVTTLRGHDGPIVCMAACKPFSIVVTGSTDRTCIIWDTNRLCYVNSLRGHEGPVTIIATSPTLGDVATVCSHKSHRQAAKRTEPACVLRVWTINGKAVGKVAVDVQINCLTYTAAPEGVCINVLAGGLANGNIRLWSSWNLAQLREINCSLESPIPVLSIAVSSCSKELYAGYSNKKVVAWVKPKQEAARDENSEFVDLGGLDTYFSVHRLVRV